MPCCCNEKYGETQELAHSWVSADRPFAHTNTLKLVGSFFIPLCSTIELPANVKVGWPGWICTSIQRFRPLTLDLAFDGEYLGWSESLILGWFSMLPLPLLG